MDRSHRFHSTPIIFAVFHVVAVLFLLRRPPLCHQIAMSNTSTNTTSWIQSRLASLYEATDANFHNAFDQTFSPACEVRLDHATHPLQTFRDDLTSRRAAAIRVSVAWNADLISTNDDKPEQVRAAGGNSGCCWLMEAMVDRKR